MQVNLWALAAAVVAAFVIGGLWYSPLMFFKPWFAAAGVDRKTFDDGMPRALIGDVAAAVMLALTLNTVLRISGAAGLGDGIMVAAWCWVGFVLTTQMPRSPMSTGHCPISPSMPATASSP